MDISRFTDKKTGQIIEVSGFPGIKNAFIPEALPPNWEWPKELWPKLLKAKEELARLDGIGRHLPNPHLLLTPLQKREAQRSSSLEGTYATPPQLLLFEINPAEVENAGEKAQPIREVSNYSRALRIREESKEKTPISLRLIRGLHQILLEGVRGSSAEPGAFRRELCKLEAMADMCPHPPIISMSVWMILRNIFTRRRSSTRW